MAKASIKSKTGALITIEGSEQEVANILAAFERGAGVVRAREAMAKSQASKKQQKKRATAADLVVELKEDGFFEKPRGLTEVVRALEEKGYLYPLTSLSGVMLSLVQRRLLRRKLAGGKWVYGK